MHRNNRKKFVDNYKHINIHKYKNCLYGTNRNKIESYIRHYLKKHNIQFSIDCISMYFFTKFNDDETFVPTKIVLNVYNKNKWINRLKLICEENEVELIINTK